MFLYHLKTIFIFGQISMEGRNHSLYINLYQEPNTLYVAYTIEEPKTLYVLYIYHNIIHKGPNNFM